MHPTSIITTKSENTDQSAPLCTAQALKLTNPTLILNTITNRIEQPSIANRWLWQSRSYLLIEKILVDNKCIFYSNANQRHEHLELFATSPI